MSHHNTADMESAWSYLKARELEREVVIYTKLFSIFYRIIQSNFLLYLLLGG